MPGKPPIDRSTLKKVLIESAEQKRGPAPANKIFYTIKVQPSSGPKIDVSTFSETDYKTALSLKGKLALIAIKEVKKDDKTYQNMTYIEAVTEEGEVPPQDEPGSQG